MALFAAWHTAAFVAQAKAGQLKPWSEIRSKFLGIRDQPIPKDWRTRKAERAAQMAQYKKHQAQRNRPLKVSRGR